MAMVSVVMTSRADKSVPVAASARVQAVLEQVLDPEIPVISVVELGIIRHVRVDDTGRAHVGVSPTYSGCPATEFIKTNIRQALDEAGFTNALITDELSPPWTSDWITESGRAKLRAYGIAPPAEAVASPRALTRPQLAIACPQCNSLQTAKISEFGSTPCKALYRCTSCLEPFDYFKCL